MKRSIATFLIISSLLLMVSCAPGPNPNRNTADQSGNVASYGMGVWHGLIIGFAFIGSWFSDDVSIYEVHNDGFWYHLGLFTPGLFIILISNICSLAKLKEAGLI